MSEFESREKFGFYRAAALFFTIIASFPLVVMPFYFGPHDNWPVLYSAVIVAFLAGTEWNVSSQLHSVYLLAASVAFVIASLFLVLLSVEGAISLNAQYIYIIILVVLTFVLDLWMSKKHHELHSDAKVIRSVGSVLMLVALLINWYY